MNIAEPIGRIGRVVQMALVDEVRDVIRKAPLVMTFTTTGMPMSVRVSAAGTYGWLGRNGKYHYSSRQMDGERWPEIPKRWVDLANEHCGEHPWDSAVINWYKPDAKLGRHQDNSEYDTTPPIFTMSLGDACSWVVWSHDGTPNRTRLESGDLTVLRDDTRRLDHAVERIIAAPLFSPLTTRGRISISMRVAGPPSGVPDVIAQPKVVNRHHYDGKDFPKPWTYIGRGTPLGNPFTAEQYGAEAIDLYREWLWDKVMAKDPHVMRQLRAITADYHLLCSCAPNPCHGDVVVEVWKTLHQREKIDP